MESIMQSSSSSSSSVNNGSSATNNNIHIQSTRRFSFQAHAAAVQQPPEAAVAWNSRWAQQQRQRQDHQHDGERNFALLSNGVDFRTLQSTPMHSPSSAQRPNSLELVGDSRQTFVWTRIFSHLSSSPSSNEIANQPPPRSGAARYVHRYELLLTSARTMTLRSSSFRRKVWWFVVDCIYLEGTEVELVAWMISIASILNLKHGRLYGCCQQRNPAVEKTMAS